MHYVFPLLTQQKRTHICAFLSSCSFVSPVRQCRCAVTLHTRYAVYTQTPNIIRRAPLIINNNNNNNNQPTNITRKHTTPKQHKKADWSFETQEKCEASWMKQFGN
jgi:hypothetical protein